MDHAGLRRLLGEALDASGKLIFLTGAGISAESGIPTFRGPQGYWTVGSSVYQPKQMATLWMFQQNPRAVWQWYLYRQSVCRNAHPNAGHFALVDFEKRFAERFLLITQNVDNLHLRAGQSLEKTYQIHGNLFQVRCSAECGRGIEPMPAGIDYQNRPIGEDQWAKLRCAGCGNLLRPHVLWFDEYYDEAHFRWESCLRAAAAACLLVTVGTSGATTLPSQIVERVRRNGGVLVDINIDENAFSRVAAADPRGFSLRMQSGSALPLLLALMSSI